MQLRKNLMTLACLAALAASGQALAALSAADAARLGADLTPIGAEKAGNKAGTIPAWDGGLTKPPAGFKAGETGYIDPFANEKPTLTITKANADQYKDNLTAGEMALLKKYDNYKINVYPTHRTAALPKAITDKVKDQATKVELQGFGLANVGGTTTPFPIPKSGLEVIWNHNVRYLGGGFERQFSNFPVRANGETFLIKATENRIFSQNMDAPEDNRLLYFRSNLLAPASLVGSMTLVHEPLDQVKEARSAWVYNAGQRRVRRAPDLAYDSITDGTEGMRYTDQYDGYNGAPDRFDFKLVGKKEIYVPYNAYKLASKSVEYKDIIQPGSVNSDLVRYELHRVWVVDATLKAGQKHAFGRRTFYIDEDSWSIVWEDAYDTRGNLWRVGMHPIMQFYDAGVTWYAANIWHDLSNGGYFASSLMNQEPAWKFGQKGQLKDFQPDALRRFAGGK
jgi:hypothetical protein